MQPIIITIFFQKIKATLYKDDYIALGTKVGKPDGSPICENKKKCATTIDSEFQQKPHE